MESDARAWSSESMQRQQVRFDSTCGWWLLNLYGMGSTKVYKLETCQKIVNIHKRSVPLFLNIFANCPSAGWFRWRLSCRPRRFLQRLSASMLSTPTASSSMLPKTSSAPCPYAVSPTCQPLRWQGFVMAVGVNLWQGRHRRCRRHRHVQCGAGKNIHMKKTVGCANVNNTLTYIH